MHKQPLEGEDAPVSGEAPKQSEKKLPGEDFENLEILGTIQTF